MSELEGQLKSAIFLMVSKIIESELSHNQITATPMFVASLVELTYNQLLNVGEDLESFANHGGRSLVLPEDLYMIVRKNGVLGEVLREYQSLISTEGRPYLDRREREG